MTIMVSLFEVVHVSVKTTSDARSKADICLVAILARVGLGCLYGG